MIMEFKINFDSAGNPIVPTLVLMHRGGKKIGAIEPFEFHLSNSIVEAPTLSFKVFKMKNGQQDPMWNYVTNFRVLWCKEWNCLFEIYVDIDEGDDTIKNVSATQLAHAELSQVKLHGIEINTENDILRPDYNSPTILWDGINTENSLMHRIMRDKIPYYRVVHVDSSIAKMQRTYTFDNIAFTDALHEIEEEIGCHFELAAYLDDYGNICREISIYDMRYVCLNCGHRNKYITDTCEKCGSHNIRWGYGQDTTIFVTSDDLGESVKFTTDTGAVKNCFKLVAGDDLMTATIRNLNPNGSDYIWYFSEEMFEDMSPELSSKLRQYQRDYEDYRKLIPMQIDSSQIAQYNQLVQKYRIHPDTYNPKTGKYESRLQPINAPIIGYEQLMEAWYKALDLGTFMKTELLPEASIGNDTTATTEAEKLTSDSLSPVAIAGNSVSITTAESAILAKARSIINPNYKVEVVDGATVDTNSKIWRGKLKVTSYSVVKEDLLKKTWGIAEGVDVDGTTLAYTGDLTVRIGSGQDEVELYMQTRIDNALKKRNDQLSTTTKTYENVSIVGLFNRGLDYNSSTKKFRDTGCVPVMETVTDGLVQEIGQYGKGNIDLYNRPQYQESDGAIATVRSITISDDTTPNASTLADLTSSAASDGFYLYITKGEANKKYYVQGTINQNGALVDVVDFYDSSIFRLEKVSGKTDTYRIFTRQGTQKKYIRQKASNSNDLVLSASGSNFVVSVSSGKFLFKLASDNRYLQYDSSAKGIKLYTGASNAGNSQFTLEYVSGGPTTYILIPTIVWQNDQPTSLSDEDAIDWYYATGQYLGKFSSLSEADEYAENLHLAQEQYYLGEVTGYTGEFVEQLQNYSLDYLKSLYDCATAALNILIEQGVTSDSELTWGDKPYGSIYNDMYLPYFNRCNALEMEIASRQEDVDFIFGVQDSDGNYLQRGLLYLIQAEQQRIQNILDIRKYLGNDKLWIELSSYRREDVYQNSNFISDGLFEDELFQNAREFYEYAEKEIYQSANLQHSIDTTMKNLLTIPKFAPLVDSFALANWLRIRVDGRVYRLRLISYEIDFDNWQTINVKFSDVFKVMGGISDLQDLMTKVSSIATSYDATAYQSEKGVTSRGILDGWSQRGLDVTNQKLIQGAEDQTQTWDSNGMLFRQYDEVSDGYDNRQLKIVNSTMAITDDNWKTVKTAVGRFYYYDPASGKLKEAYGINGDTIVGRLILGEQLGIYNSANNMTFDAQSGLKIQNSSKTHTVQINPNSSSGLFQVLNGNNKVLWLDAAGMLHISGDGAGLDITANDSVTGLQSTIQQTADSINASVKSLKDNTEASLNLINGKAVLRVNKETGRLAEVRLDGTGEETSVSIQAEDINISGRTINLTSETLSIESTYFGVTAWGYLRAESGTIGGLTINQNSISSNGSYGGLTINPDGSISATAATDTSKLLIYGGVVNTLRGNYIGQLSPGQLNLVGSSGGVSLDCNAGTYTLPSGTILTSGNYTDYINLGSYATQSDITTLGQLIATNAGAIEGVKDTAESNGRQIGAIWDVIGGLQQQIAALGG